jgi:hypothetical protein
MMNKLAAKEIVEAYRCLKAARNAPAEVSTATNGWQLAGWNKAGLLTEANACFNRAKLFRDKARKCAA